jgi:hypothetical protein
MEVPEKLGCSNNELRKTNLIKSHSLQPIIVQAGINWIASTTVHSPTLGKNITVKTILTNSCIKCRTNGRSRGPFMHLWTSYARTWSNTTRTESWFNRRVKGEQGVSPSIEDIEWDREEGTERLCQSAVEGEVQGRRSPADLMVTGATNLAALNNAAAISFATLCNEESVHSINSPPWLVPPPLRPA